MKAIPALLPNFRTASMFELLNARMQVNVCSPVGSSDMEIVKSEGLLIRNSFDEMFGNEKRRPC